SRLEQKALKDYYGRGALPINYPNRLDVKRGKSGAGIWLHGTPSNQFARPPQASDGCVVLANPDLERILRTVEIGTTPVVIAAQLEWVDRGRAMTERKPFEARFQAWIEAKVGGSLEQVLTFYASDFDSYGQNLDQWLPLIKEEMAEKRGRKVDLKDVSYLQWIDGTDTMVVNFSEVVHGRLVGTTKRQYWTRAAGQWKIFFEATL
ncbi:MAG: L,D-transpeptidase family protein, partial [Rhodoferax sp.]